jgi:hypothetical protein
MSRPVEDETVYRRPYHGTPCAAARRATLREIDSMQKMAIIKRSVTAATLAAICLGPVVLAGPSQLEGAAAEPDHSGAWHCIAEKSSWSNGQFPKTFSLTLHISFDEDQIRYHSVNDTNRNTPANLEFTAPLDGTVASLPNNVRFNQVSVRMHGPNELEMLKMKDGDVIVGSFWRFSADGKMLVRRGVDKGADGKSRVFEEYFTRG